jgi:hypothetical protein
MFRSDSLQVTAWLGLTVLYITLLLLDHCFLLKLSERMQSDLDHWQILPTITKTKTITTQVIKQLLGFQPLIQ